MRESRKLDPAQYIRISGAAGHTDRPTHTTLNDFTDAELTEVLSLLCDYCTQMERQIDLVRSRVNGIGKPWIPGSAFDAALRSVLIDPLTVPTRRR